MAGYKFEFMIIRHLYKKQKGQEVTKEQAYPRFF